MSADPSPGTEDELELLTLQHAVQRLEEENDQLRRALRTRGVIEQAKGVLMATHGVDAEDAFARLRRAARDGNRRLVEVAADELARYGGGRVTVARSAPDEGDDVIAPEPPPEGDTTPTGLPRLPSRAEHDRGLVLLRSAVEPAGSAEQALASLAATCSWPHGADRATLLRVAADGGLDLVASVGIDTAVASRWRHIPMSVDFPATQTARTGEPVFVDDPDAAARRWPALAPARASMGTFCDLPLLHDGVVVGVVGLGWPEGTTLGGSDRRLLRAAVTSVADVLLGHLGEGLHSLLAASHAAAAEQVTAGVVLDAVPAESVLLVPLAPAGGDLLLAWGNSAARRTAARWAARQGDPFGRRVSEVAPHLIGSSLWRALHTTLDRSDTRVVRDAGWFWQPEGGTGAGPGTEVTLAPVWNGALASRSVPADA